MANERDERRLTAIVAADVVGYARLIEVDESGTLNALRALRSEVTDPRIAEHTGRIVSTAGDSILAEFASVVDAVQCAAEIQRDMASRNDGVSEDQRIQFRIGVNLGDIIVVGDDIHGDGVNVAARLEGLADPGGIFISGAAFDQVQNKLELGYESLGEQKVKNIAKPVRVYRVLLAPEAVGTLVAAKSQRQVPWRLVAATAAILILVVGGGAAWWQPWITKVEAANVANMAYPLPDKPSIAVLPFDNLSGDPEQDFLTDGLTENIISSLSKVRGMLVIARNSTFTYKGKPVKVQRVAEDLGVRYVLEGSVQRDGGRLRVNAQLIDAVKGHHLWSETYDRELDDLFAVQDDITRQIVVEMQVQLTQGEQARIQQRSTNDLKAWGYAAQAYDLFERYTPADNAAARELFRRALELDPNYAWAMAWLGFTHRIDGRFGFVAEEDRAASHELSVEAARKAIALDDSLPDAHTLLAAQAFTVGNYDEALEEGRRAIALDPNAAEMRAVLANTTLAVGNWDETIALGTTAVRLHPQHPSWFLYNLGRAYTFKGQYDLAIATAEEGLARAESELLTTGFLGNLAFAYMEAGQEEEARRHMAEYLRLRPKRSAAERRKGDASRFKNPTHMERILAAWVKAGLPENPPLELPDKPSIAVLPFDNLSDDPEQEYFSDGMADTLLTDLSRLPGLLVIARNSSFAYKGKAVDVRRVGRELGVKFVLEGSVLRAGDRVRVNAQLVDTTTGAHVWAERFDDSMDNVFGLQDRLTRKIVTALEIELTGSGEAQRAQSETTDLAAYDAFLQGWARLQRGSPAGGAAAIPFFERAIALDPEYGRAYAALALTHQNAIEQRWWRQLNLTYSQADDKTKEYLARALERPTALAHRVSAQVHLARGEGRYRAVLDAAAVDAKRAIELEPNNADGHVALAQVLLTRGEHEEALDALTKAKRLDPQNPQNYDRWGGQAQFLLGRFEDAALTLRQVLELDPEDMWLHMWLGVVYAQLGREEEGRAEIVRLNAMRKERSGLGPINMNVAATSDLGIPDQIKLRMGLRLAGVSLVSAPPVRRGDRVKGEDLRAIVRSPWWYGNNAGKGQGYWRFVNNEGKAAVRGAWAWNLNGWRGIRIENEQVCFTRGGRNFCAAIYRNPDGSRENSNEYILLALNPGQEQFFSTYEERPPALKDEPLKDEPLKDE